MTKQNLAILSIIAGAALGWLLAGLATWAEIEATQYGFPTYTQNQLALRCPPFLGPQEQGRVQTSLRNEANYTATFTVRVMRSSVTGFDEVTERIKLAPGERRDFTWPIGPEHVDLGRFIFVSVHHFGGYPTPPRQSVCGVFVTPWPWLTGQVTTWGGLFLTLVLLGGGWLTLRRNLTAYEASDPFHRTLGLLVVLIPLTMVAAFWFHWFLAAALLTIGFIALMVLLSRVLA